MELVAVDFAICVGRISGNFKKSVKSNQYKLDGTWDF